MKSCLIVLVLSFFVVAGSQKAPSFTKKAFEGFLSVITGGMRVSPHIIGGSEVAPHSFPYQVALSCQLRSGQGYRCGGSLIAPEWVLTAAHCSIRAKSIIAHLGCHNFSAEEPERQKIVVKSYINPSYDRTTKANDIALLRLENPAILNEYVRTVRLPSLQIKHNFPRRRTPVILTGWGMRSKLRKEASPVLQFVETPLLSSWQCAEFFGLLDFSVPETVACANGAGGRGSCIGDSGGPMTLTESDGQKTILGVASFGGECGAGHPSAYTRVDIYLEWISEHTGIALRQKQA